MNTRTIGYTVGMRRRVRFDPSAGPAGGQPGNLLIVGAPGAGKSYAAKQIASRTLRADGRVVVLSFTGEDSAFADVVPGSLVVDLAAGEDAGYSLDPPRVIADRDRRRRILTDALAILCGAAADGRVSQFLSELARYACLVPEEWLTRLLDSAVSAAEASRRWPDVAPGVYEDLGLYERVGQPPVLFGTDRPALSLDRQMVAFDVQRLWDRYTDTDSHRARDVAVYLAVAAATETCRSSSFSALLVDPAEPFALTHPAAWQLVVDHIRQGAYLNSATWLVVRDSTHLGFDRPFIDSYLPHILAFTAPKRPFYKPLPHHVEPNAGLPQGECLWQDRPGRVRHIRIAAATTR